MNVKETVELLGHETAIQVAGEYGGKRMYVSTNPREANRARDIIGAVKWAELLALYRNESINFPRKDALEKDHKLAIGCARYSAGGESYREIAADLGIDRNTLKRAFLNRNRPSPKPTGAPACSK